MQNDGFLEPWEELILDSKIFEDEFYREICKEHKLFNFKVKAIARRGDQDTLLFEIENYEFKYAVVHLTFKNNVDDNPKFPSMRLFKSLEEWKNKCMIQDHLEFK